MFFFYPSGQALKYRNLKYVHIWQRFLCSKKSLFSSRFSSFFCPLLPIFFCFHLLFQFIVRFPFFFNFPSVLVSLSMCVCSVCFVLFWGLVFSKWRGTVCVYVFVSSVMVSCWMSEQIKIRAFGPSQPD